MKRIGWKLIQKGWESPGWYNIVYEKKGRELMISEADGKARGKGDWGFGVYSKQGDPISGYSSHGYPTKTAALKGAKSFMRRH